MQAHVNFNDTRNKLIVLSALSSSVEIIDNTIRHHRAQNYSKQRSKPVGHCNQIPKGLKYFIKLFYVK